MNAKCKEKDEQDSGARRMGKIVSWAKKKKFKEICKNLLSKPIRSCIILFVAGADVAQPVERILGKDEVHEFDSRHQLQMKTPLCEKRRGVVVCILRFFEGLLGEGRPFFRIRKRTSLPNRRILSAIVSAKREFYACFSLVSSGFLKGFLIAKQSQIT